MTLKISQGQGHQQWHYLTSHVTTVTVGSNYIKYLYCTFSQTLLLILHTASEMLDSFVTG